MFLSKSSKSFSLSLLVGVVMVVPPVAQGVEFKISGQINRAVLWADNGVDDEVVHVDNDNSSTRFRFVGSQDLGNGFKAGIVWESQFESNTSSGLDIPHDSDGDSTFTERKLEAWFSGGFGKLSIGQGDGAANNSSEVDLSGTSVVTYSGIGDMMGGVRFVTSAGVKVARINDVFSNFDGLSRNDRLRYDTPTWGPISLSISATNGDAYELAAWLAQDFGGGNKLAAAIGYVDTQDRGAAEFEQWGASASYLHSSGISLTVAAGNRDTDGGTDADNWYVKGGYKIGKHAISLDYGETDDLAADGDEFSTWGLGYVLNAYQGIEIYAGYRNHELDRPGVSLEDIDGLMVGTRIKFF